eukprot:scaffold303863_cov27-Tisochrysis_lutea.AAC.2
MSVSLSSAASSLLAWTASGEFGRSIYFLRSKITFHPCHRQHDQMTQERRRRRALLRMPKPVDQREGPTGSIEPTAAHESGGGVRSGDRGARRAS